MRSWPGPQRPAVIVFTLVGDNFFTTTAVSLQQGTPDAPVGAVIALPQPTYLSRQLLQVTVNQAYFTVPQSGGLPVDWFLKIANPAPATNPGLPAVTAPFVSLDPTQPSISGVVNAASYQQASVWAGGGPDPVVSAGGSPAAVAPREIISIFGQNLGPSTASTAQPLGIELSRRNRRHYELSDLWHHLGRHHRDIQLHECLRQHGVPCGADSNDLPEPDQRDRAERSG